MKTTFKSINCIYQDTQIHIMLQNEGDVMVNATEMAKVFGKEVKFFTRLQSTKMYIEKLLERKNMVALSAPKEQKNSKNEPKNNYMVADVLPYNYENIIFSNAKAGTYMCRHLAIKFAAWLDIDFEMWINETIENILFSEYYIIHRNRVIEIQEVKSKIEMLEYKIMNDLSTIEDAKELVIQQRLLKKLTNEKKNAISNQVKSIQYTLQIENT
jgi:hypothetical protein